jgi:hypothetical protein
MIESLCLISAKFTCCILMIENCFSHAMKNCALSRAPQGTFFYSLIFAFENSDKRDFLC